MQYDFIVVGSGPAGSALAYRLATTKAAPQILLLEAGGKNDDAEAMRIAERFTTFMTHPHYNWNYMTVPQKQLANREVNFARGKGLGGSSAINFCFYTRGPKDDFDEWARRVGDDFFNWENAERRFKTFENFDSIRIENQRKYAEWKPEKHGTNGPVKIFNSQEWESDQESALLAAYHEGWKPNMDGNSGDPLGVAVGATTGWNGYRTTAKTAYLDNAPSNMTIVTQAQVTKILFENMNVIGVKAGDKEYFARKEVILCAGALDTPKLLMLSGVGPETELSKHNIPIVADLPVGIGLQDHVFLPMSVQIKEGANKRAEWSKSDVMAAAQKQFDLDGTGPLSILFNSAVVGFAKGSESVYSSAAFNGLPKDIQDYLRKETVPTFEMAAMIPAFPAPGMDQTKTFAAAAAFNMGVQSRGTVTLKSANPGDPPISDPNFMSHPFDRVAMIDGVRRVVKVLQNPLMAQAPVVPISVPKSDSDEDILEFIRQTGISTWHMSSTAMMGRPEDKTAVVTSDFKVKGLLNLRIADMSVTPFLPNCHTVSTAYLIGETAAERITMDWGLDELLS